MQILAHNQYIPTRIDIFTAESETRTDNQQLRPSTLQSSSSSSDVWKNNNIHFQRLGYITFDDNSKTNYCARELKSISLDIKVTYIKLVIHSCHHNHKCQKFQQEDKIQNSIISRNSLEKSNSNSSNTSTIEINPFHQVGVVKIILIGKKTLSEGKSPLRIHKERSITLDNDDDDNDNVRKTNDDKVEEKIEKASIGINTTFAKTISPSIVSSSISNKKGSRTRRKKKSLNFDIEEFKSRLSILEKKKLDMAAREVSFCRSHWKSINYFQLPDKSLLIIHQSIGFR